jgi:hypothetical protein
MDGHLCIRLRSMEMEPAHGTQKRARARSARGQRDDHRLEDGLGEGGLRGLPAAQKMWSRGHPPQLVPIANWHSALREFEDGDLARTEAAKRLRFIEANES